MSFEIVSIINEKNCSGGEKPADGRKAMFYHNSISACAKQRACAPPPHFSDTFVPKEIISPENLDKP